MHPLLFEIKDLALIGDLQFHAYATFAALAFLIPTLLCAFHGSRLKDAIYVPTEGATFTLIGALIGSKVFYILQYESVSQLYRAVYIREPGLVFYGGVIGGTLSSILYLYIFKCLDWRIVDLGAPYIALGFSIGRLSCFFNGCCWGTVSNLPWALSFPAHSHPFKQHVAQKLIASDAAKSLPVHPTQLYLVLGCLALCLFLLYRYPRLKFRYSNGLMLGFGYGTLRFAVEVFRGDSVRSVLGVLTVSQAISLGLMIGCSLGYAIMERRARRIASATPPDPPTGLEEQDAQP